MDSSLLQTKKYTEAAYLWSHLLSVPFWGLINVLPFILYKNMHISPLLITIIVTIKPVSALFAPYWSQISRRYFGNLTDNLIWSNILRYVPFLFMPWIDSPWIIIAAFCSYMAFYRGSVPAWMEVIKCNLPDTSRERLVAYGSTINYCGLVFLPLVLGTILDGSELSWRWLFFVTALVGLSSTIFIYRMPTPVVEDSVGRLGSMSNLSLVNEYLVKPWTQSWQIMRQRPDFASFLIGFMLGGTGIMIMQPTIPVFFADVLNLSFTEMLVALSAFKGIGFVLASPVWIRLFRKWSIHYFCGLVIFLAGVYPLLVAGAQYNIFWLYAAYGLYGVMQAGSELGWHMSGPIFAQEGDSTAFSETNVHMVGIRGCIVPPLGALLGTLTDSTTVMFTGSAVCLIAFCHFMSYSFSSKGSRSLQVVKD